MGQPNRSDKMREVSSNNPIMAIVEQALASQQVTPQQYFQLMTAMLADRVTLPEQRSQINRIFDEVKLGRIEIVYW